MTLFGADPACETILAAAIVLCLAALCLVIYRETPT